MSILLAKVVQTSIWLSFGDFLKDLSIFYSTTKILAGMWLRKCLYKFRMAIANNFILSI
jgi:hypothetical protein